MSPTRWMTLLLLLPALLGTGALAAADPPPPAKVAPKPAPKAAPAPRKPKKSPPPPAAAPAPVVAPTPAPPPPVPQAPPAEPVTVTPAEPLKGRLQLPGEIDARLMLNTDILLIYINLGVGADVGVARLGPGVLSIGGEFEAGLCFSACLALKALTGWSFSNAFYSPHARVAYHFIPGDGRGLEKVDLYGLVLGGITYTTTRVSGVSAGTDFDYQGHDVAPSGGVGVGAKYFIRDRFFLGAEARLRLSSGLYTYSVRVGNASLSDSESSWSLSGINVQLFGGLRL